MPLYNYDSNMSGIYKCIVLESDTTNYTSRVYIPSITKNNIPCPLYNDGTINETIYQQNINSYPIASWCVAGINVPFSFNAGAQAYVMFEAGNINYPVILDMTNIMSSSGLISNGISNANNSIRIYSSYTLENGEIVDAHFTAYYATPSATGNAENVMQGGPNARLMLTGYSGESPLGFKQASDGSTVLDYTKNMCAAPEELFKRSQKLYNETGMPLAIMPMNTGKFIDNQVYWVVDSGGAIDRIGDKYDIDILMKDRKTAFDFGVEDGKIMIGGDLIENNKGGHSDNPIIQKAIDWAVNTANDPDIGYSYGGVGPRLFDCSHFVYEAYHTGGGLNALVYANTSSMKDTYSLVGFKDVVHQIDLSTGKGLMVGDVLVASGHTAMIVYDDPLQIAQASTSNTEFANQVNIRNYSYATLPSNTWIQVLRYSN